MGFSFFGYFEFFMGNVENVNFQKIGEGVVQGPQRRYLKKSSPFPSFFKGFFGNNLKSAFLGAKKEKNEKPGGK